MDKIGDKSVQKSAREILNMMGHEAIHPDLIAEKTLIPTDEIYALLLEWELDGVVVGVSGGRYQRMN